MTWPATRLKFLFDGVQNGMWGEEPRGDATDFHCVRGTDFDRTAFKVSILKSPMRSGDTKSLAKNLLRHGDLVLEKSGGSADQPVGSVALFDLHVRAVCSNFNARLRVSAGNDPRYITYLLNSMYSEGVTRQFVKQTTGIQNLDAGALLAESCTVPALVEQRRIADFLDVETTRIDELAFCRNQQLEVMDELALAKVSASMEAAHDTPMVRLGYLAAVQSGITIDGNRDNGADPVTRPYLRVANVQAGYVKLDSVTEVTVPRAVARNSMLRAGDVLMTEGGDLDKLGRGTVWRGEIKDCLHQNHVFAVRPQRDFVDPDYLALLTRTMRARAYFESTGTKTTNLASTSSGKIRDFRIPLIGLDSQQHIVKELAVSLGQFDALALELSNQLDLFAERRQALITAAVTGRFDVSTARGADLS